jgi:hypothetical protein
LEEISAKLHKEQFDPAVADMAEYVKDLVQMHEAENARMVENFEHKRQGFAYS